MTIRRTRSERLCSAFRFGFYSYGLEIIGLHIPSSGLRLGYFRDLTLGLDAKQERRG